MPSAPNLWTLPPSLFRLPANILDRGQQGRTEFKKEIRMGYLRRPNVLVPLEKNYLG